MHHCSKPKLIVLPCLLEIVVENTLGVSRGQILWLLRFPPTRGLFKKLATCGIDLATRNWVGQCVLYLSLRADIQVV